MQKLPTYGLLRKGNRHNPKIIELKQMMDRFWDEYLHLQLVDCMVFCKINN